MGWTFSYKPASQSATDYLRKRLLDCDNERGTWKTLATAQVGSTVYAAVERLVKATGERYVFAAVMLTQTDSRSDYNFGWKDLDESMGPYQCDCPERILKLLTPTGNENAIQWRLSCREKRRQVAERKKLLSTIKPGMLLSFMEPFRFCVNGEKIAATVFEVRDMKRRLFTLPNHGNLLVRLRRDGLARGFTAIDAAQRQEVRLAA